MADDQPATPEPAAGLAGIAVRGAAYPPRRDGALDEGDALPGAVDQQPARACLVAVPSSRQVGHGDADSNYTRAVAGSTTASTPIRRQAIRSWRWRREYQERHYRGICQPRALASALEEPDDRRRLTAVTDGP